MAASTPCITGVIPPLADCLEKNNCELSFIPGSCARTKCAGQLGCYYNCVVSVFPANCAITPATCSSGTGTGSGSSTTNSAVSVGICMWLALVLIVFSMF
jgi:hypothetical protein